MKRRVDSTEQGKTGKKRNKQSIEKEIEKCVESNCFRTQPRQIYSTTNYRLRFSWLGACNVHEFETSAKENRRLFTD